MAYRLTLLLFMVSGALGLGYQVLWSKYLLDFIGVSAYSYGTVLAAFMAGLALGSSTLGPWADRARRPLRLFAGLELGVGLYAFAYPSLVAAVAPRAQGLGAKVLAAGLLLIPPTTLMGGTYPAVLRHVTERVGVVGRRASQVYSVNAAGAALGALVMAFLVVPGLGLRSSLRLLGSLNVLLALSAFLLSMWPAALHASVSPIESPVRVEPPGGGEGSRVARALVLVAVAGFTSFVFEIAWTRYFSVVLGSSTYSFAIILAAFITGIALGSAWLASRGDTLDDPLRFFGWTQLLLGLTVVLPLPLYPYVPWLLHQYGDVFSSSTKAFVVHEIGKMAFCYAVLLPAAVLVGMSLPLMVRGVSRDLARLGRDAGRVYAWNTWGNVAGALAGSLTLLPALGMEGLLRLCALVSGSVGFAAVWLHLPREAAARRRAVAGSAAVVAALLIAHLCAGPWQGGWFTLSPFRRGVAPSFADVRTLLAHRETVLFEDDPAAHVLVFRTRGRGEELFLLVDGKGDASSSGDMPTQLLLGHVPLMLAPEPRDVLVIGLGSGVTAGAVLRHPVRRLDVVEIVAAMPRAARFFGPWSGDPLSDPRTRLIVDDARSYLLRAGQDYDVIISEPSNPWMAGVGSLFSKDFYRQAARALRAEGVYLQWLQAYEMGDETFAAVVRTFRSAFPFVYAFQATADDMLLLGSRRPLRPNWSRVLERFERPEVREQMTQLRIEDLSGFLALQALSPPTIERIADLTGLENTDDNHLLEYRCPRDLFGRLSVGLIRRFDERPRGAPSLFWTDFLRGHRDRVSPLATLRALSARRAAGDDLTAAHRIAAYHVSEGAIAAKESAALFPDAFRAEPPPSRVVLAERIERLLAAGQPSLATGLVQSYSTALVVESVLSKEAAEFWIGRTGEWLPAGIASGRHEIRAFRIDLLMAAGDDTRAAEELLAWGRERLPPAADWAVARACQVDSGDLCSKVRGFYGPTKPRPAPSPSAGAPASRG